MSTSRLGYPSLVTRITSDTFVLMQFADQILKLGTLSSFNDGFSILDFDDQSIFSLDCGHFLAFPSHVVWYVAVKERHFLKRAGNSRQRYNQYAH